MPGEVATCSWTRVQAMGDGLQLTLRGAREVNPLVKYWRNKPLPVSFVLRGREYCRSATNTRIVSRWGQPLRLGTPFSPISYPGLVQQHRHFTPSPVPPGGYVTDRAYRGSLSRDVAPCRHRIRASEASNHRGDLSWFCAYGWGARPRHMPGHCSPQSHDHGRTGS